MAKKKEPDKLALEMMQCVKDGYGCHYGAWKAMQDRPVVIEPKPGEIPEGWLVCKFCRKPFKPRKGTRQVYCDIYCQHRAQEVKRSEKNRERQQWYRDRKKAEQEEQEERMKLWDENLRKV